MNLILNFKSSYRSYDVYRRELPMKRLILTAAVLLSTLTLWAQSESPLTGPTEFHKHHNKHHSNHKSQHPNHQHHHQD
jgi:hypothetical protein